MKQKFGKLISYLLSVSIIIYPLYPYADELQDIGREAQEFSRNLTSEFNSAPPQFNSGELTFQDGAGTTTVNVDDLFPGTSSTSGSAMTDYFPDGSIPDISALQGVSTDGSDMEVSGNNMQSGLWEDAESAEPSITGSAYKVMIDMANTEKPDLSADPVFTLTRDVFSNIDEISAEFGDCSTSTSFSDIVSTNHIPEYHTCERIVDNSAQCEVNHFYDAGVIQHFSGPYNILPLDDDSINVWIGTIGDNYYSGNCTIFEEVNEFVVLNPAAITKVSITYAKWDDYMQILVGEPGNERKVWSGPNDDFPPETSGRCELNTNWEENINVDITDDFLAGISAGDIIRFKIRVSVTDAGEGFARLQIDYDPDLAVLQDIWTPQSCIDATEGLYDGFATGSVTCTSIPTSGAATGCVTINEVTICNEDLGPSPFPDIPALCNTVAIDVDYDFYKGSFCYITAIGEEVCVESGGAATDTCVEYEVDPQCGFISQNCLDGAQATDGTCYILEEVWDCGIDVDVPDIESETTIDCVGPIRCMGADCLDPERTQSSTFAQTSALLNAAQFMTQDMNCTDVDGTADVTCKVFGGEAYECKIAVGGVQDCCDLPTSTTAGTYIAALMAMAKLDSALMALESGNAIRGAYQVLRAPIAHTVSTVTKPFASYVENISGAVGEFFQPITAFVENLKDQIKDTIVDTINKMIGDTAADLGADAATTAAADAATEGMTDTAGEAVVQNVGAAANFLMTAYTIYVVTVMVIQLLYECEEEEFQLAAKNGTKSCHYVGSYCAENILFGGCLEKREAYCCFNSPLSRIINQQIRPQLARPFGNARDPDCGGIEMSEVASIDWSLVDLSEWTALLSEYDLMPDVSVMNLESLTGSGSDLNDINGTRVDAGTRAEERLDGIDVDAIRREAADNTAVDPTGGI